MSGSDSSVRIPRITRALFKTRNLSCSHFCHNLCALALGNPWGRYSDIKYREEPLVDKISLHNNGKKKNAPECRCREQKKQQHLIYICMNGGCFKERGRSTVMIHLKIINLQRVIIMSICKLCT